MSQKILIVDDEPQITRVLRTALESNGYQVVVARDGVDATREGLIKSPRLSSGAKALLIYGHLRHG